MGPLAKGRKGEGVAYGKREGLGKWGLISSSSLSLLLLQEYHGYYEGVRREK